jgi:hypothetical protein
MLVKNKAWKYVKTALKIILTGGALYFVFTKIDLREVLKLYGSANPAWLTAAVILFAGSKVISAYRLNLYFRNSGIVLSQRENLKLYATGMFYNLFLPGGIGGDGYKIFYINRKHGNPVKKAFWAVLHDRANGLVTLACIALIFINFTRIVLPFQEFFWLGIPLLLGGLYLAIRLFFTDFLPDFFTQTALSVAVQLLQVFSALAILLSIGVTQHLMSFLFLFLASSIVAAIPITVGGVGSRELTFYLGSGLILLDTSNAIALSLMFYFISVIVSFIGLYYILKPGELKIGQHGAT